MKLKSRFVTVATAASPKNVAPVPAAAIATICAPLASAKADCSSAASRKPIMPVKASSSATPSPLSRFFSIRKIMP